MICSFHSPRRNDAQTYRNNLSPRLYDYTFAGSEDQEGYPRSAIAWCHCDSAKSVSIQRRGYDLAYDAFYSAMKAWGKYQIVGSPNDADLIVELAYRVVDKGTRIWSSTNTYTGATQVHSREVTDPQLVLTIYDAKTKNSLWSTIDHRRLAMREKNREKETINSAERLVDELKTRATIPQ
jgi:hypothetical protein